MLGNHEYLLQLAEQFADDAEGYFLAQDAYGRTPSAYAAMLGASECCSVLQQRFPEGGNVADAQGRTALHHAALNDRANALGVLLASGVDPYGIDTNGQTVLHCAAHVGSESVGVIVNSCSDADFLNAADNAGYTALHYAATSGNAASVASLLSGGAAATMLDGSGHSALDYAIGYDHSDCVSQLISAWPGKVAQVDSEGRTLLMHAAAVGSNAALAELIRATDALEQNDDSSQILAAVDPEGRSAMHMAAFAKNVDGAALLLVAGADPDAKDNAGETAVMVAAATGGGVLLGLQAAGWSITETITDAEGKTALHHAAIAGNEEGLRLLVDMKPALASTVDSRGETALHYACFHGHHACATFLCSSTQFGAELVNCRDNEGITALHWAARQGHASIVDALIHSGSHMNIPDHNEGRSTALDTAIAFGNTECAERIVSAGGVDAHTLFVTAVTIIQSAFRGFRGRLRAKMVRQERDRKQEEEAVKQAQIAAAQAAEAAAAAAAAEKMALEERLHAEREREREVKAKAEADMRAAAEAAEEAERLEQEAAEKAVLAEIERKTAEAEAQAKIKTIEQDQLVHKDDENTLDSNQTADHKNPNTHEYSELEHNQEDRDTKEHDRLKLDQTKGDRAEDDQTVRDRSENNHAENIHAECDRVEKLAQKEAKRRQRVQLRTAEAAKAAEAAEASEAAKAAKAAEAAVAAANARDAAVKRAQERVRARSKQQDRKRDQDFLQKIESRPQSTHVAKRELTDQHSDVSHEHAVVLRGLLARQSVQHQEQNRLKTVRRKIAAARVIQRAFCKWVDAGLPGRHTAKHMDTVARRVTQSRAAAAAAASRQSLLITKNTLKKASRRLPKTQTLQDAMPGTKILLPKKQRMQVAALTIQLAWWQYKERRSTSPLQHPNKARTHPLNMRSERRVCTNPAARYKVAYSTYRSARNERPQGKVQLPKPRQIRHVVTNSKSRVLSAGPSRQGRIAGTSSLLSGSRQNRRPRSACSSTTSTVLPTLSP